MIPTRVRARVEGSASVSFWRSRGQCLRVFKAVLLLARLADVVRASGCGCSCGYRVRFGLRRKLRPRLTVGLRIRLRARGHHMLLQY